MSDGDRYLHLLGEHLEPGDTLYTDEEVTDSYQIQAWSILGQRWWGIARGDARGELLAYWQTHADPRCYDKVRQVRVRRRADVLVTLDREPLPSNWVMKPEFNIFIQELALDYDEAWTRDREACEANRYTWEDRARRIRRERERTKEGATS